MDTSTNTEFEWIENFFPQGSILKNMKDKERILSFCLLWMSFEKYACNTEANFPALTQVVNDKLLTSSTIDFTVFEAQIKYFKNRYILADGNLDEIKLTSLYGTKAKKGNDLQIAIEEFLKDTSNNVGINLLGLLCIVYRLRNNLLHGVKDPSNLTEQMENFKFSNQVLMNVLTSLKKDNYTPFQ
ncbi:hypothetical protein [Xanthocytophaga agilis]|uniref:Uncharacterized protein n=1 Tax=Xanthocytophaga agilis TaxID=3048010 RepID=A0AAE3UKA6_9BACT|nr:hypothetical protein [Xanthocytophaga agilis]MDJ1506838.1 hypothetical protein [Xanthocytophaga agilis]